MHFRYAPSPRVSQIYFIPQYLKSFSLKQLWICSF